MAQKHPPPHPTKGWPARRSLLFSSPLPRHRGNTVSCDERHDAHAVRMLVVEARARHAPVAGRVSSNRVRSSVRAATRRFASRPRRVPPTGRLPAPGPVCGAPLPSRKTNGSGRREGCRRSPRAGAERPSPVTATRAVSHRRICEGGSGGTGPPLRNREKKKRLFVKVTEYKSNITCFGNCFMPRHYVDQRFPTHGPRAS